MSTVRTIYQKYVFGLSFFLKQFHGFLLEIHNHSRHTFRKYCKEGKNCQNGSSFVIPLNLIHARLFYCLKVQEWIFSNLSPFMITGTIQASPMKLCTVMVLLEAYQNTKEIFKHLTCNVTITSLPKTMRKF